MEQVALLVYLWCTKVDPTMIDYCEETVMECTWDEGKENAWWCQEDYALNEGIIL